MDLAAELFPAAAMSAIGSFRAQPQRRIWGGELTVRFWIEMIPSNHKERDGLLLILPAKNRIAQPAE